MKTTIRIVLVATLLGCLAGLLHAEVSTHPKAGNRVDTLVIHDLGITDGVDPIPQIWLRVRRGVNAAWTLNAPGVARGDGGPHIAHRPNGWPVVVWAYNNDSSFDVALSQWDGSGWSPIEFLTSSLEDEIDPRVFVRPDGTLYVTWWVNAPDQRVMLATVPAPSADLEPMQIQRISPLGEPGRRPSVAMFGGQLWVAYERDAAAEVFHPMEVVVRRVDGNSVITEHVAAADRSDPLDAMLHVNLTVDGAMYMWLDWKSGTDVMSFSRLQQSGWQAAQTHSWPDESWVGEETARKQIAGRVRVDATSAIPLEY